MVVPILINLVKSPECRIEQAYTDTVSKAYQSRDISSKAHALAGSLAKYHNVKQLPEELKSSLQNLRKEIDRLLGDRR
jgi:hypothetical protein